MIGRINEKMINTLCKLYFYVIFVACFRSILLIIILRNIANNYVPKSI